MVARLFTGTQPPVGKEFTYTLPGGYVYELLSITATLTASATVGFRTAALVITDETTELLTIPPPNAQAEAIATAYWWVGGVSFTASDSTFANMTVGLPAAMFLPAGYILKSATDGLKVDDQWSAPTLWVDDGIPDPALLAPVSPPAPKPIRLVGL